MSVERGVVLSIPGFRLAPASRIDNIKSCSRAIEIAKDLLKRLKVDLFHSSNLNCLLDTVQTTNGPLITYWIMWPQVYCGLRVVNGFILVIVSAEKAVPVSFRNNLVNASGVYISPVIRRGQAAQIA